MPAEYSCDKCGSTDGAHENWEGMILCEFHSKERELYYETVEYKNKRDWVRRIHIKDLIERRKKIAELKAFFAEHAPSEKVNG